MELHRPLVRKVGIRQWQLMEDYHSPAGVVVPKGFITDGATIPKPLWAFMRPEGYLFEAAILHDYLYQDRKEIRVEADYHLYSVAVMYGCPKWKARAAYLAVRLFGWMYY